MTPKNQTLKLSIFNSIINALAASVRFFLGVHFIDIGFSGAQIGMIFAISTITSIITILPSGFGNDAFKSKHLIGLALILETILYFGLSLTNSFSIIAVLFLFGGIGHTIYNASADSLFYKSTEKKTVHKKIGMYLGITHIMIGLGMFSAGLLRELSIPFSQIFLIISVIFLLMTILSQIILPDSQTAEFKLLQYKKDIFRPKVLIFMVIVALFAIHFAAENTSYGLFLKEVLLFSSLQMGLYMGSAIVMMGIFAFIISKKFQTLKPKYLLLTALFVSGSGHILMTLFKNPYISAAFRIYHEIGDIAYFFFLYYGITRLFDLERIGGNAGVFTFIATLSSAIFSTIFGPMGAKYGWHIPLIVSGGTSLLAGLIAIQFLHHFDHKNS